MSQIPGCETCATPFLGVQVWLAHVLHGYPGVARFMMKKYSWHMCETLHFFGLSLLVGTIGVFDLRVLGMAKRIPVGTLHRLKYWGIAGFVLNTVTGMMFLVTFPDQYLFQWPFWYKAGFILLAGLNAVLFDVIATPRMRTLGPGDDSPVAAKLMCAASLCLWIGVIFAGRFLAFYKPLFSFGNAP